VEVAEGDWNPWESIVLFPSSPRRGEGNALLSKSSGLPRTYSQLLLHVVFSTKHRERWITPDVAERLYPFTGGIIRAEKGILYDIGGIEDHVHLYLRWRPDAAISDLMRTIKSRSSLRVHQTFPRLDAFAWQEGYAVFSVSKSQEGAVKKYIASQAEHHRIRTPPSPPRPWDRIRRALRLRLTPATSRASSAPPGQDGMPPPFHGFRVGPLRGRAAPPVATPRGPAGADHLPMANLQRTIRDSLPIPNPLRTPQTGRRSVATGGGRGSDRNPWKRFALSSIRPAGRRKRTAHRNARHGRKLPTSGSDASESDLMRMVKVLRVHRTWTSDESGTPAVFYPDDLRHHSTPKCFRDSTRISGSMRNPPQSAGRSVHASRRKLERCDFHMATSPMRFAPCKSNSSRAKQTHYSRSAPS
jgi:REP-associated tyrosine transposase